MDGATDSYDTHNLELRPAEVMMLSQLLSYMQVSMQQNDADVYAMFAQAINQRLHEEFVDDDFAAAIQAEAEQAVEEAEGDLGDFFGAASPAKGGMYQ